LGAASIYDLYKSLDQINAGDISVFAVGLLVSFVVALLVIKFLLNYVARHDFKPFAWYRIAIGAVMAALFLPM
jgi:undecaprenyl-diphosphatase